MVEKALPNFALDATQPLGQRFAKLGLTGFREAAAFVWGLPYGRVDESLGLVGVIESRRGTCSSKHALLAALAREHGQPVALYLGIYLMDDTNTPGVGSALQEFGLTCVPEAHCFLVYRNRRIDLTHPGEDRLPTEYFLQEQRIEPEQSRDYKLQWHRDYIATWAKQRKLDPETVWEAREACILALSAQPA